MHFSATIIALTAVIVSTVTGAPATLDQRSDAPCRPDQEFDMRCSGTMEIQMCDARNGGHYWTYFRHCNMGETCIELVPGEPRCRPYVVDCWPWCSKISNGTDTDVPSQDKEEK